MFESIPLTPQESLFSLVSSLSEAALDGQMASKTIVSAVAMPIAPSSRRRAPSHYRLERRVSVQLKRASVPARRSSDDRSARLPGSLRFASCRIELYTRHSRPTSSQ